MAKVSDKEMIGKKVKTMESRHSASTIMKNAGVSPHYIKEVLGHASLKTTENYLAGFEDDIHLNPNSTKKEFSLRDPDGYYLTITEFHKYEG